MLWLGALVPSGVRAASSGEPAASLQEAPESAKTAHYRIQARYDETKQRIEGHLQLRWTNRQARPTQRMALRTYMNVFADTQTSWMHEIGRYYRGVPIDKQALGFLHIQEIAVEQVPSGPNQWPDLPPGQSQPLDWDPGPDPSTIWVTLPRRIAKGQSIDLHIEFQTQLPRVLARTGHAPGFVMAAQWYPKAAVYSKQGWQAPAFDYHAEFFSDFADYEVALDLPAGWELVSTGARQPSTRVANPARQWRHLQAHMVHDFAWAALRDGELQSAQLESLEIQGLLSAQHSPQDSQHLALLTQLVAVMKERYGPYPWPYLSFVLPPPSAKAAQGMEYPTFFSTDAHAVHQLPPWLYTNRYDGAWTTIHEFGHQYFHTLVASDEASFPWIDEGLNTFTNAIVFEDVFGKDSGVYSFLGYPFTAQALLRQTLYENSINVPIDQPAKHFHDTPANYGATVYGRCALVFSTLRAVCGPKTFDQTMRDYVAHFAYSHPSATQVRHFFAQSLTGRCPNPDLEHPLDLTDFFAQSLDTPFELDYFAELGPVRELALPQGWQRDPKQPSLPPRYRKSNSDDAPRFRQNIVVYRKGEPSLPLDIQIHYQDGTQKRMTWPAQENPVLRIEHDFSKPAQAVSKLQLDPQGKIVLERHKLNNIVRSLTQERQDKLERPSIAPIRMTRALQILAGNLLP